MTEAPCPICGETVTVSEVYDSKDCSHCGASLEEMQRAASEQRVEAGEA